jgi:hypothetical protein
MAALADLAHNAGAWLAVDNCFATPALQRPIEFGADIVMHSGTKYLDGQGRVMAGALCAPEQMVTEKFLPVQKNAGMVLSPFNAWVVLKGLETLDLRMKAQSAQALALASGCEAHPAVAQVYYPGLASHPQHALAMRQMSGWAGRCCRSTSRPAGPEQARERAFPCAGCAAGAVAVHQPGRHQNPVRPPGQHLARQAVGSAAPGRRHRPGPDPRGRGPRTPAGHPGRPARGLNTL